MTLPSLASPCCFGITLQQGVQLIAALQIGFGALMVVMVTIALIGVDSALADEGMGTGAVVVFWVILMIILALSIGLHVLLLLGANEKSKKKVKISLILYGILLIVSLLSSIFQQGLSLGMFFISVIGYFPFYYQFWVVFSFFKEIRDGTAMSEPEQMY